MDKQEIFIDLQKKDEIHQQKNLFSKFKFLFDVYNNEDHIKKKILFWTQKKHWEISGLQKRTSNKETFWWVVAGTKLKENNAPFIQLRNKVTEKEKENVLFQILERPSELIIIHSIKEWYNNEWNRILNFLKTKKMPILKIKEGLKNLFSICPHILELNLSPPLVNRFNINETIVSCKDCGKKLMCLHVFRKIELENSIPKIKRYKIISTIQNEFYDVKKDGCFICGASLFDFERSKITEQNEISLPLPKEMQKQYLGPFLHAIHLIEFHLKFAKDQFPQQILSHAMHTVFSQAVLQYIVLTKDSTVNQINFFSVFLILFLVIQYMNSEPKVLLKVFEITLNTKNFQKIIIQLQGKFPLENIKPSFFVFVFEIVVLIQKWLYTERKFMSFDNANFPKVERSSFWTFFNSLKLIDLKFDQLLSSFSLKNIKEINFGGEIIEYNYPEEIIPEKNKSIKIISLTELVGKNDTKKEKKIHQTFEKKNVISQTYRDFILNMRSTFFNVFPNFEDLTKDPSPIQCSFLKSIAIFFRSCLIEFYIQRKISNLPESEFIENFHGYKINDLINFLNEFVIYYNKIHEMDRDIFLESISQTGKMLRESKTVVKGSEFNLSVRKNESFFISDYLNEEDNIEFEDENEFDLKNIMEKYEED